MTDRELMERAAKAADYSIEWCQEYPGGGCYMKRVIPEPQEPYSKRVPWSPLQDDGDALRLAVELQLGISVPPVSDMRVEVVTFYGPIISIVEYPKDNDRCAATRRAIVRAAAATVEGEA